MTGIRRLGIPLQHLDEIVSDALALGDSSQWASGALAPLLDAPQLARIVSALTESDCRYDSTVWAATQCAIRASEIDKIDLAIASLTRLPEGALSSPIVDAASRLSLPVLWGLVNRTSGDVEEAAVAESAAAQGDHILALHLLEGMDASTWRDKALVSVAELAQPSWVEDLLPEMRKLPEWDRAEALAALLPHIAPEHRSALVNEIVECNFLSVDRGQRIMAAISTELAQLPPKKLAQLWTRRMHTYSFGGRQDVLVNAAAFASTLIEAFGADLAPMLDDAIRLGASDHWP
jgi:hypothetical protein